MLKERRSKTGYEAAGASHRGCVRPGNEDAYLFQLDEAGGSGNFVVCDGMGGAAAGEIASRIAAETMLSGMSDGPLNIGRMQEAVAAANSNVYRRAEHDPALAGMGTTLIALGIRGANAWVANVGDSRCYRLRGGEFERLTQDHSLVDEQVRLGRLTAAQAAVSPFRNVITRAIGTDARVTADIHEVETIPGDIYLLASDGLTRELSDERIARILHSGSDPKELVNELIEEANRAGGHDNVTCILVHAL
jgi:serine/threonine protein phosphatase PrpC